MRTFSGLLLFFIAAFTLTACRGGRSSEQPQDYGSGSAGSTGSTVIVCPNPAWALCEGADYRCRVCCPTGSWVIGGQCTVSRDYCDMLEQIYGIPCLAESCSFANSCYQ
jgi:hypothetical protein